ncbi:hypothetical protein MRB53_036228 [Persea americana]|uniref:Uncharacterized protein n=1 Tax=Persea americana TaxID=3435 RepID=A0ACC2K6Z3_PERAE|nr:hypothetical protein MRB53_036228 [Persea americana]
MQNHPSATTTTWHRIGIGKSPSHSPPLLSARPPARPPSSFFPSPSAIQLRLMMNPVGAPSKHNSLLVRGE